MTKILREIDLRSPVTVSTGILQSALDAASPHRLDPEMLRVHSEDGYLGHAKTPAEAREVARKHLKDQGDLHFGPAGRIRAERVVLRLNLGAAEAFHVTWG